MRHLVFLGPPGSGKGTQAAKLAAEMKIRYLSTGDLLRAAVSTGTELGRKARGYMERGELVPDALLVGLIEATIRAGELDHGFILDGFPRTVPQAEALRDMLNGNGKELDAAVLLAVSDEEVVRRLSGRWFCPSCQATYNYPHHMPRREGRCDAEGAALERRPDDQPEVVRRRLDVYKKQTRPIEDFYRAAAILVEVQGEQPPEAVFADLLDIVGARK
ncbi:MAG TPA: adenylate kinase [candidate division Zixibacteria bacterium]|nr:adenylate kinase [candidate division Zixibacteria bacterium]MDM7971773.1 adenylate kinase [candidate division Zixibacteria bacterium]HOD67543.1 adenylate kinase [candidate division Zixibacteria bacterium]HPC12100.1 adenylate kinase [candidate division Zixibacteria bacterium]HPI32715.1 adenylate kinase [candidate division Zixibacteria bacterium]